MERSARLGFEELQAGLGPALSANRPGSRTGHVLVAMPSYSLGESLLSHYASRIPALEHRYLVAQLMLHRIPSCEMVFVSCQSPDAEVLDHYVSLVPAHLRSGVRARFRTVTVEDYSPRSMAAKLLDHPTVLDALRASFRGRPAFIEPWNVTEAEVEVALRLQAPVNGTAPELWPLGFKSAGRRLLVSAGVPVPPGREDVRDVEEVVAAVAGIRAADPTARGVVVKLDDSGSGVGNAVLELSPYPRPVVDEDVRIWARGLPESFRRQLEAGGVVEQLVSDPGLTSPSVQVDVRPSGDVVVLATHEQVLDGHVYLGCRFPADPAYVADLARHGRAVGERLAARGVVGRFSVDFVAVPDGTGRRRLHALEVNLRKGGTTHPYAVLRNLVPGTYDEETGCWMSAHSSGRSYVATDNLVDPGWLGLPPAAVVDAVDRAGLRYDRRRGSGVVLHMLSCLAIDGRFGLTAIGHTPDEAEHYHAATVDALHRVR